MKIVGIVGSLREDSYNNKFLKYVLENFGVDISSEILLINKIPLFNEELEDNVPVEVIEFKSKIKEADAVIISSPEYNYSIPGVLKNALDWASRDENPFNNKKVGIISASLGMLGGARMQYHLRQVLLCMNADVMRKPEIFISNCDTKINEINEIEKNTKESLNKFIEYFKEHI